MSAQRILRCPRPIGETLNKEALKAEIAAAHAKGREEGLREALIEVSHDHQYSECDCADAIERLLEKKP